MIPDTPAGRQVGQWLECLALGERDRLRDFVVGHYSAAALAQRDAGARAASDVAFYRGTRELLPVGVERSTETELVLLVRARLTGELLRLHGAVEEQRPHPIVGIHVAHLPPADDPYGSIVSEDRLVAELGDFVDLLADADCFSGAVLLARGEEVLLECAHGLARREPPVPNRPQTRFNHGSIQKMLTAVAIAQLAERGRLDFADEVSRHLPDFPGAVAAKVTIEQLLTHRSGMAGFGADPELAKGRWVAGRTARGTVSDHLAVFAGEPLAFEPGERFGYSNAGYAVLGAVVEQVSGQDYYEYVREHICGRAGMAGTDCYELGCEHPDIATGYTLEGPDDGVASRGPFRANLWALPQRGAPYGLGFSTVGDLHRFGRALLAGELLSPAMTELVLGAKVLVAEGASYCYGFQEVRFGGVRTVGHGGGFWGASADFGLCPELGYTVAVLSNYNSPAADRVANHARRLIEASSEAWRSAERSPRTRPLAGERVPKRFEKHLARIKGFEPELEPETAAGLRERYERLRERALDGEQPEELLCESFALTREASRRALGRRHIDVQLIGGMVLHEGSIAEMKGGEGKTLTSTLPICLHALYSRNPDGSPAEGKGIHLVTPNDDLAGRAAESVMPIYDLLGVSVGILQHGPRTAAEQRAAYAADVTYGAGPQFGFDYLRDNLATKISGKCQRGHGYAIVAEADSVLIDEARTPLIVSGRPERTAADVYTRFAELAATMQPGEQPYSGEFHFDERHKTVALTALGVEKAERFLGIDNLYSAENADLVNHLQQALKAQSLYRRGVDYEVVDGEVKIIDQLTGRLLGPRRWSEGLHQAVEAKEGVAIQAEHQTLATIPYQNFFRRYEKLAGTTATAITAAAELREMYKLDVVQIPTDRPVVRHDRDDEIYRTKESKWAAVLREITQRHERGQPVLVATISMKASEHLSEEFKKRGIEHTLLNAKPEHAAREAEIIAEAGRPGAVTIVTNIAGRRVAIELGGNAQHDRDKVVAAGGLFVLGTERHDSRRIDDQLRDCAGRRGDPGETRFHLSAEDDLVRLFAGGRVARILDALGPVAGKLEQEPIEAKALSRQFDDAQRTVEERNLLTRKRVLAYDGVMNRHRDAIYGYRDRILAGEDMSKSVRAGLTDVIERMASDYTDAENSEEWDLDGLLSQLARLYPCSYTPNDIATSTLDREALTAALRADLLRAYEERECELGAERVRELERAILLQRIDERWRKHLHDMDQLRERIHLRGFAQIDPLVAYNDESLETFTDLMTNVWEDVARHIFDADATSE